MGQLMELWLPIIASAVFVFVVSSIMHMLLPIHRSDYKQLSNEAGVLEGLRTHGIQPGEYMFPHAGSIKEAGSPEMIEKFKQGPVGMLTILPSGVPGMGKSLVLWFLYSVLVSIFVAYMGKLALDPGDDYMRVFRVTGTMAVFGYAVPNITASIWKGQSWVVTGKFIFDGVVYGLVTAGAFGWLWPAAA